MHTIFPYIHRDYYTIVQDSQREIQWGREGDREWGRERERERAWETERQGGKERERCRE